MYYDSSQLIGLLTDPSAYGTEGLIAHLVVTIYILHIGCQCERCNLISLQLGEEIDQPELTRRLVYRDYQI